MSQITQPFLEQPSFEYIDMDVDNTVQTRVLNWVSDFINVQNLTPYPLYINWRTGAIPTPLTYEAFVPAATEKTFAAVGNNFAFFLDIGNNLIPAVGKKCLITIQRGGVPANSSEVNWRSSFDEAFNVVTVATYERIIPVSGAVGLSISIQALTSISGILIAIATSIDGNTFSPIKNINIRQGSTFRRQFSANVNFFRIRVTNNNPAETATGLFSYSLLQSFASEAIAYTSIYRGAFVASLAVSAQLNTPLFLATGYITYLDICLHLTTGIDWQALLTFQGIFLSSLTMILTNQVVSVGSITLNIGIGEMAHRRLNEVFYRIPVQWHVPLESNITITNGGSSNLSNVAIGYELMAEM